MFHVIDDNEDFLEFVSAVAKSEGYGCRTFNSPQRYLEFVRSKAFRPPIAVISDVQMPGMDGFSLLNQLRNRHNGIRTAVVSGYPGKAENLAGSYCLYLKKPALPEALIRVFRLFSRCHQHGPDEPAIGCQESDDRDGFHLDCWSCPLVKQERENP